MGKNHQPFFMRLTGKRAICCNQTWGYYPFLTASDFPLVIAKLLNSAWMDPVSSLRYMTLKTIVFSFSRKPPPGKKNILPPN
jgi:hypothetical protein